MKKNSQDIALGGRRFQKGAPEDREDVQNLGSREKVTEVRGRRKILEHKLPGQVGTGSNELRGFMGSGF